MTRPVVERTLFVTRYHPVPAHTGTLQYSSQLIGIFAALSARLDVVCQIDPRKGLVADDNEPEFPDNVVFFMQPPTEPSTAARMLSGLPYAATIHASAQNRRRLDEILERRPNCIVIDHIASSWAYEQVARHRALHPEVCVVYCSHNMEIEARKALLRASWGKPVVLLASIIDVLRIDRMDRRLTRLSDVLTCISSVDMRQYVERYRPGSTAVVRSTYLGPVREHRTIDASVPRRVCTVGSYLSASKKNNLVAFLKAGYDAFEARGIEVVVVGRMDPAYRRAMQADWPKVTFTGPVAEVRSYMASSRIGVTPESDGGSFTLKSVEYVFNRLPLFSMARAVGDFPLVAGESIEAFSDIAAMCRAIVEQIDRTEHLDAMQRAAFEACAEFRSDRPPREAIRQALLRARRNGHRPRVVGPVASRPAPAVGKELPCTMRP